jgi:hypothetical protein
MVRNTLQSFVYSVCLVTLSWLVLGVTIPAGAVSTIVPSAGVYDDYQAVQAGEPSRELPARLNQYTHQVVGFFRSTSVELYQLDLDRVQGRGLGTVFALSDGVQLYLHPRYPSPVQRFSDYVPVEPIGPYLYGQTVAVSTVPYGDTQRSKAALVELLYDTRTGRFSTLNKRSLRVIISKDTELLSMFDSERWKGRKLKRYLQEYTIRNSN